MGVAPDLTWIPFDYDQTRDGLGFTLWLTELLYVTGASDFKILQPPEVFESFEGGPANTCGVVMVRMDVGKHKPTILPSTPRAEIQLIVKLAHDDYSKANSLRSTT